MSRATEFAALPLTQIAALPRGALSICLQRAAEDPRKVIVGEWRSAV